MPTESLNGPMEMTTEYERCELSACKRIADHDEKRQLA